MSASTASSVSPPAAPSLLRRHWRLVAFLLCGVVPFAPSIWAMQSFLLADNALGFVPFMLPAAAYLFWLRTRIASAPAKRDVVLDCFFAGPAIVTALFLLFLTPAKLSWYFWLYRVDLLAMVLVTIASGFVFLGYQQVLRSWQAFVLLFLAWPYPAVALQELVSGPMTAATVLVARGATSFLQLPYTEDGGAFTSRHLAEGDNFSIALTSVCSGSAVTMGFLLVGAVLVMLMR
ncbi:MAG: archaeosortase/exosortase family protein, partial [Dehalococcoidia bacterium]